MITFMNSLKKLLRENRKLRKGLMVFGWCFLGFALVNLVFLVVYKDRTYPGTKVQNQNIGNIPRNKLENKLSGLSLLPEAFMFEYQDKKVEVKTKDLGIETNTTQTATSAVRNKAWLPIANFVNPPEIIVTIKTDPAKLDEQVAKLSETFKKDATDAKIQLDKGAFSVVSESTGYVVDKNAFKQALEGALRDKTNTIIVPVMIVQPKIKQTELATNLQDLKDRQNVSLTYRFNTKVYKATPQEISDLHEISGSSYVLSDTKLKDYLIKVGKGFGISILNISDAIRDTRASVQNKKPLEFTFKEAPKKTYTYCVASRGVDASELSGLQNKLASVFADARGWSIDNRVSFVKADSSCNFTVWLAEASQMSSFGAICDSLWSCAVRPNIIINYDRWKNASDAWNQKGGSLDDYRTMVINHETGHWLGFGHVNCGGPGQSAPVMQQQSINLQGCNFNPWPLPYERDELKKILGI